MAVEKEAGIAITSSLGGVRRFTATAAVRDTPAGSSVDITITNVSSGTGPPQTTTNFQLSIRVDTDTTTIKTFTLSNILETQVVTFHFTSNGDAGGAARCGTLRMRLFVQKNNGLASENYTANSDSNTGDTLPTGWSVTDRYSGLLRATTTNIVHVLSNIALGGGKNLLGQATDSLFLRMTLAHIPYRSWGISMRLRRLDAPATVPRIQTVTDGLGDGVWDVTWSGTSVSSGRVNKGFPVEDVVFETDHVIQGSALNTLIPWTELTGTITRDLMSVDPRITVNHHLQHNLSDFASPPSSLDVNPKNRLTSDLSFVGFQLLGARNEGLNGIVATETLTDAGDLLGGPVINRSVTTQVQGGEDGWVPSWATWDRSLPVGGWDHVVDITSPDLDTLENNGTESYTLLGGNPSYSLVVSGGPVNISDHVHAGGQFQAGVALMNTSTRKRVPISAATAAIMRLQSAGANAGYAEYLAEDGETWVPLINADDEAFFHILTETRPGSEIYTKVWPDTTLWGDYDIFVVGRAIDETGTPYGTTAKEVVVGGKHKHTSQEAGKLQYAGVP